MATVEIERKFLVERLPPGVTIAACRAIRQGYVAIAADGSELRVREVDGDAFVTVKSGGHGTRREVETPIETALFDALWPLTAGRRVEKQRQLIPHDGVTIELDVYGGSLEGLLVAEVEFESSQDAERFSAPAWFGREVTDVGAFKNQSLAVHGLPPGAAPPLAPGG